MTFTLENLTIDFGDGPLIQGASLSAATGDVIGIQGANGSGKTSLLRVIARVSTPADGTRTGPDGCAYVPPTIDPLPMRSGDWLRLFPRERRDDPRPLLQDLGFDSDLSKKLADLSFGNLRKLLLAEALTSGEQLIVIDEFGAGLDGQGSRVVASAVRGLAAKGVTMVLADQQDRPFPVGARTFLIQNGDITQTSADDVDRLVEVSLRGPHSQLGAFATAAANYGFEALPGELPQ